MIIEMMQDGMSMEDMPDYCRTEYGEMTDDQICALRQKYKKYEKAIFSMSWEVPSLMRFQETCAAMCLALELATKTSDPQVIYCPWFFEAFNTLASRLIKEPKGQLTQKGWEEWCRSMQENAQGICAAMGCWGDYMVQYVRTVYPDPKKAPGRLIQTWQRVFAPYFDIKNTADKNEFVKVAFHLLLGYDKNHMPKVNTEIFHEVARSCLTEGWPKCSRTKEDCPSLISNPTNDEICQMLGIKLPPPEERDRIKRESEETMMRADLETGEKESAEFFGDMSWMRKTNPEIGVWRVTRAACRIGRKAVDYRDFYYNKSREEPMVSISDEISDTGTDSFLPVFEIFTRQFCYELPSLQHGGFNLGELLMGMIRLCGAMKSMLHYLDKLPHDRHLGAAKRAFDTWYDAFAHVVRGQIDIKVVAPFLLESVGTFKTELSAASDVLNERENMVHDKNAFQEVAPTPKFNFTQEKMFKSDKDINYVAYLERAMSACRDAYRQLGEDTSKWPREMLPFAATMEMLLIIDASERLKERLKGNDVPPSDFPPLHILLDPKDSAFLAAMKRICMNFPSLSEDEYTEGLYEQLFSVGFMSEFYLGLSTSDDGVRIMPDYRDYWVHSFSDTFCSPEEKLKPLVTLEQTMASYAIIESCCAKLSREAEIQNNFLFRKLYAEGKLPPGNVSYSSMKDATSKNLGDISDVQIQALAGRISDALKNHPVPSRVVELDATVKRQIILAAHAQMAERDYFSDPNLATLFGAHPNSIANWRKGKGAPEGFHDAFEKKDYKAMTKSADKYKASRARADVMNTKAVEHGISEEQIYKQGGNRSCADCGEPQ